jgi:hypothetical protein
MSKLSALLTKVGMMAFIISMCIALPIALLPQALLHKLGWISRIRQEQLALTSGQFCARWLLRLIPFCHVSTKRIGSDKDETTTEPSIWVCNHTSALDVFILLAKDKQLRGTQKRPIKIVYVSAFWFVLSFKKYVLYFPLTFAFHYNHVMSYATTVAGTRRESRYPVVVSTMWLYPRTDGRQRRRRSQRL